MRLTTSQRRQANRMPVAKPGARHSVPRTIASVFGALSGQRERDAERSREQFDLLDIDQRVRRLGEW
jgi:hypothetical protein